MSRRVELLLFTAGWGANHFATLLVVYRRDLGLSPAALGILFGAYALGLVPGLIFAGRASDARGRRAIVLPAGLLAIAASGLLAFGSHGFAMLLAGRLLYGLAMGSIMSPGSVWVQELSPSQSSAAVGARRATLALSAGFGLGPLVSGLIAELAPAPMVLPYLLHGVLMAGALAGVLPVADTARAGRAGAGAPLPQARGLQAREFQVLAELLPMAPWAFGLASVTIAILPGLMRARVTHPILYSGLVIVTTLLSGVLVQPLAKRVGPRADLLGLGLGVTGMLIGWRAVAVGSWALAFPVALLVGAGYGLIITTGLIEVSERASRQARGTIVGIYYVLTYVGFALPFVHATLARRLGDATTLLAAAITAVICLVLRAMVEAAAVTRRSRTAASPPGR
jgi:MFS family permease